MSEWENGSRGRRWGDERMGGWGIKARHKGTEAGDG